MAGAPVAPQAPQAPEQGGGASKLVTSIHSQLNQLATLMDNAPVDDGDKQQLAQVISGFESLVEGLGAAPGQKPQAPAQPGVVPPEAGAAEVKPAM